MDSISTLGIGPSVIRLSALLWLIGAMAVHSMFELCIGMKAAFMLFPALGAGVMSFVGGIRVSGLAVVFCVIFSVSAATSKERSSSSPPQSYWVSGYWLQMNFCLSVSRSTFNLHRGDRFGAYTVISSFSGCFSHLFLRNYHLHCGQGCAVICGKRRKDECIKLYLFRLACLDYLCGCFFFPSVPLLYFWFEEGLFFRWLPEAMGI